ncbi:cellular morphogenesis protein (Bud22) [Purpureocillium lavendulum]|uniref:Cellular morphogenesis protein (Bud22) n=1 Tax=Purpureocillium lavendulum TaxID=1247861 RepID=A0AB34FMT4_9HYPO|nr:cellular morphogenesis protein (Bud22) [Purpureocillium lavendulum]
MPKRKRSDDASLPAVLEKHQNEVSRALKTSKGFERQRLSKRLREDGLQADKKERLEREVTALKSLDLHRTARVHLISSLLKVKSIAASSDLPDELRTAISKPDLPEAERVALHNVTSALYNKDPVRQAVDKAITAVCGALNIAVPPKGKRVRKDKRAEQEEQPSDRIPSQDAADAADAPANRPEVSVEDEYEDETDFEGFESDINQPDAAAGEPDIEAAADEETEFSRYDDLLGSSDDDDGEDFDLSRFAQFKGKEKVNLDDISLSGPASDVESDVESDAESDTSGGQLRSPSPSPPPKKKRKEPKQDATSSKPTRDSTFLPSLMGGYISGSESASDIEEAKPKKRRGQRARQAIWEQKYGSGAKHLLSQPKRGGRDSGWDMKRGAVEGDDQGRKTPWKKGIHNPLARRSGVVSSGAGSGSASTHEPKPAKRDDEGPLHPSWVAKKKAQESLKSMAFSGQKVVFD